MAVLAGLLQQAPPQPLEQRPPLLRGDMQALHPTPPRLGRLTTPRDGGRSASAAPARVEERPLPHAAE